MSWVSVHRSGIRLTTLRLRSLMRTSLTLSGHGSKGRTPVFSSCPGESASYAVHSRLESDPPDTPVEEVTLILSSLTQMGLFDGPRRDQERRIAETGRRLRDRLGGVNALYRVEEIAPWHPAPEMRALQVPVDPLGAGGRQAAPLAGARGGQGRAEREPVSVLYRRRWRHVARIDDRWMFDLWWLPKPVTRSYYRVDPGDGVPVTVLRDEWSGRWVPSERLTAPGYVGWLRWTFIPTGDSDDSTHELTDADLARSCGR